MDPLQFIPTHHLTKRFGPDPSDTDTTHWMRWDRQGWKVLNEHGVGPNGHGRDWTVWSQHTWDKKLVERIWELRKFICDNLDIHEYEINTLTVSPFSMMILEMDPSLVTHFSDPDSVTYILGSSFIVNIDFEQDDNRVYLGSIHNEKEGCILIDNHETE
jgi:hypothetical protein